MEKNIEYLKKDIKQLEELFEALLKERKTKIDNDIKIINKEEQKNKNTNKSICIPVNVININNGYPLLITCINNNLLNEGNDILLNIKGEDYKKLEGKALEKFLLVLYKFVEKLPKKTLENMSGVSNALRNISNENIKNHLHSLFDNIFSKSYCIYNIDRKITLEYAIKFFNANYTKNAKFIISELIERNLYNDFNDKEMINLLLMSLYLKLNNNFIKDNKFERIKKEKTVEAMLINDLENNENNINKKYINFMELKGDLTNCNIAIAKKVFDAISDLDIEINELYINKYANMCEFDKEILWMKSVKIPVYNQELTKEIRKLEASVLWCKKCNTYSLNNKMLKDIYKKLKSDERLSFKNIGELNKVSPLMVLGYNTNVKRKDRHKLLNEVVIPTLGIKKVISHIKFLIDLNENRVTKDYSRALSEWNCDIEMIRDKYKIG